MLTPQAWPRYRPDWRAVGWLTLVLVVVTSLPTVLGSALQTPQLAYTGARWFSPQDAPVYYAWIQQAADGEWLLSNRFSAELDVRGTLNLYWVVVGKLAALLGLLPMTAFALARLASIPLMVLAVDFLASRVLASRGDRRWALALACLASGWGFILLPWLDAAPDLFSGVPATPVDLWVPEATLMHTALHSGHLAAAVAVLAVASAAWINALRQGTWRDAGTLVLLTWVPLQLGLLYAPVAFQRRLMIGLPVGLALLGAPVLRAAAVGLRRHLPWAWAGHLAVAILGGLLLAPSSAYVLAQDFDLIARRDPVVFADRTELDALAWLAQQTPRSAVVFAPPAWGGLVPAWAGRTTVVGHPIETVDADAKARLAQRYFSGTLDAAVAEAWLRQQRVTHVLVSRGTSFAAGAGLAEVFANSAAVIYAVAPP